MIDAEIECTELGLLSSGSSFSVCILSDIKEITKAERSLSYLNQNKDKGTKTFFKNTYTMLIHGRNQSKIVIILQLKRNKF